MFFRLFAPALAVLLACTPVARAQPVPPAPTFHELTGVIDETSVDAAIDALEAASGDTFMFVIDSPGGYVSHGMRLVKAIERSPKKVACVVDGLAASMAAVVLQACTFRAATERSVIMFHGAGVGGDFEGQEHDFRNMAERLRVLNEALNRYTCRRLTVEYAVCAAWTAAGLEKWMTPRDAIDVGALDAVIPFLPAGT